MSDIRKWMKLVESTDSKVSFIPNESVQLSAAIGGGVGRYVKSTPGGAQIDVKGDFRDLKNGDFAKVSGTADNAFATANHWKNKTIKEAEGNESRVFVAGDMVKIKDVYGAALGSGMGVFVAYSTGGQDCIVNFDGKDQTYPVKNVEATYEQEAKDDFDELDNDGEKSPFSADQVNSKSSSNEKAEENEEKDEEEDDDTPEDEEEKIDESFEDWARGVEESLLSDAGNSPIVVMAPGGANQGGMGMGDQGGECGCGSWDCQSCFPDPEGEANDKAMRNAECGNYDDGQDRRFEEDTGVIDGFADDEGPDVDGKTVSELAHQLASGEITYSEFKDQLASAEHTAHSMRQGEMGLQGHDTPAGNRAWDLEQHDWNGIGDNKEPDDEDGVYETSPMDIEEVPAQPKPGKTLGHIVQKVVPVNKSGEDSPLTKDNLSESATEKMRRIMKLLG